MPKNAIIVGLPRSGTSMTAFIFAQQGYFTVESESDELRAGDLHNPSGYLEAETLIKFNAEIFAAAGYPHDNTWLFDTIEEQQSKAIGFVTAAHEHIQFVERYNKNHPWLWKDPRLCYTLDFWWPLVDKDNTGVLLLKRDPEEIYQSFIRVKWRENNALSKRDVYKRVSDHLAAAERTIERYNIPHIVVEYGDYQTKPQEVARRMGEFFGIELNASDLNYSGDLNHSSLRGRLGTNIDLWLDRLPAHWIKKIKQVIPTWAIRAIYPERFK